MTNMSPARVCAQLIQDMHSLHLATVGADSIPHCGYTPYLFREPCSFYIFVSQLATHTRHLLANSTAAMMVIADEQSTSQIFARVRVHYECIAQRIPSDHPDYEPVLNDYQQRHGETVGLLRQLPDFVLFHLRPKNGQFVMGFGQAYSLAGDNLAVFEHTRTG